ncbi:MAG: site-2 protease family protein [Oscillospiraceae bacterium]|jgi:regulator of sigma E protease|nr:site-2 protease family protein [Oscillospiraceae bacterium]
MDRAVYFKYHIIVFLFLNVRRAAAEFALGMGPKIWSRQKGETLYSLRLLPFGGFCAMEGEDGTESEPDVINPRSFNAKSWWKRCLILVAGALANFILGYLIIVVVVAAVNPGIGVWECISYSWRRALELMGMISESIKMLFNGKAGVRDLAGPVGIVSVVNEVARNSETAREAAANMATLFAFIAINLGIFNLLPIPALDGGRVFSTIFMTALEKLSGRKLSRKAESYIHAGGFILLLGLMAFTLINDIVRIAAN